MLAGATATTADGAEGADVTAALAVSMARPCAAAATAPATSVVADFSELDLNQRLHPLGVVGAIMSPQSTQPTKFDAAGPTEFAAASYLAKDAKSGMPKI